MARQMSLHLSLTETPEYFGTQTTDGLSLLVFRLKPLNASHCSSRKLFPVTNNHRQTRILTHSLFNMRLKDLVYLNLYKALHCRSDASLSVLGSTCPRFQGRGCYSPFWRAAPLHHTYGNTDHTDPIDPNGHLPAERVHMTQK